MKKFIGFIITLITYAVAYVAHNNTLKRLTGITINSKLSWHFKLRYKTAMFVFRTLLSRKEQGLMAEAYMDLADEALREM
jgi:hypothetical protein